MVAETYSWKAGVQFPVEAKVAADTIRDLQKSLGKDTVTAKELLDASRDENAPLHSCFEWNDNVAAELYRTSQARKIINSVEVTIVKKDDVYTTTRLFLNVSDKPKAQGKYAVYNIALTNNAYRENVLRDALLELQAFQRRYSEYQELAAVFEAINAFADRLK